ncbi:Udp-glycosyltransferase 84b1 [Thalictrum thalictroides]|uniref:Glycosyltransferase n=1 Tax=Thalictrum thalictroides TaxID=46969 RepID=A0A7J6V191_THATH|nr:Udp-glycosyltransferase 84b1 [Thalictrum thalictroides]
MVPENEEVHVLLITIPAQGHINPMLMFAKVLVSKGVHVTLATVEASRKRLIDGSSSITNNNTAAADTKFYWEFFSDDLRDDFDRSKNFEEHFRYLFTSGPPNVSNLIKKLSDVRKFSCLICNPFVPWVVDVAVEHNIPCALLWIQPSALYAIYYHFYNDLSSFPTLENPDIPIELPGVPCLSMDDMPSFIHPSNPYPSFKLLLTMIKNLDKVKWVLGSSFYELEKEVVDAMAKLHPITPVGPLVPPVILGNEESVKGNADMWKADDSCLEWLNKKPHSSVIYISFGSSILLLPKQMENIAWALKKINKPFLWVVKPSENPSDDGNGELPKGFIEETKDQGLVVTWCSQARVLSHPSIACFVSHCGWNSLLDAVASGVPVIALPQWTDQPANTKLLVYTFKTGINLQRDDNGIASKEEVERCILEITEGPKAEELKKNATHWKDAARKSVAKGGSSDKNLDLFIDDISGFSSKSI